MSNTFQHIVLTTDGEADRPTNHQKTWCLWSNNTGGGTRPEQI